jgi:hypothetical protein
MAQGKWRSRTLTLAGAFEDRQSPVSRLSTRPRLGPYRGAVLFQRDTPFEAPILACAWDRDFDRVVAGCVPVSIVNPNHSRNRPHSPMRIMGLGHGFP